MSTRLDAGRGHHLRGSGFAGEAGRVARVTVLLLFLAWLVDYIDRLVITLALPMIGHDFGLDKAAQGLILTVFFITYCLFQLPGGLLADRIGARRTMVLAMVTWSLFTALTGFAFNYVSLLVVRTIFGISEGIFPGASMKAVAARTTREQRLTANGLMVCSNPLGAAIAPLIAAPALAAVGWKDSFFIVAVLGIIIAFVVWRWLPPPLPGHETDRAVPKGTALTYHHLLRSRGMWLCVLMFCGLDIVAWGLISWTPSYLMEVRHLNVTSSGLLTSVPFFAGTAATVLGGFLFDRVFHHHPRRLIVPVTLLGGVSLWLMIHAATVGQFILFESIADACSMMTFMPIYGMPLRLLPPSVVGAGSGLINFGGQFAGAITPVIMGVLADRFSFSAAFGFLLFGIALTVLAAILSPQTRQAFVNTLGVEPASLET
jgi:MFS family permease